ncbi:MAG: Ig-like domain-containing protein, partial [Roseimicrobium sp.]
MRNFLALFLPRNWGRVARAVFGDATYRPPGWLVATSAAVFDHMRRRPGVWVLLITLTGSGIVGNKLYSDWQEAHKPRPKQVVEVREVTSKLYAPGLTPIVKGKAQPENLVIEFSGSFAPVELVGKPVTTGVTLTPATKGAWTWSNDRRLVFQPSADWPAGTDYEVAVNFPLPPATKLKQAKWSFTTKPFAPSIAHSEFYTDPTDPAVHQVVTELRFTHPVAKGEIEKRIT